MERFSSMAREVFEAVFYKTDISKAENLIDKINSDDQLGVAFGKCCTMFYYQENYDTKKLLQTFSDIEKINISLNDPFIKVITDLMWFLYYSGGDFTIINFEKAKQYFNNSTRSYQWYEGSNIGDQSDHTLYSNVNPDDWEKYFVMGWYHILKAQYHRKIDSDLTMAIESAKMGNSIWTKIPTDGEYLTKVHPSAENCLGWYYHLNGELLPAESWFLTALKSSKVYENLWELWPNMNLYLLNNRRGDLYEAKKFNQRALEIARRYNNLWAIYINLSFLGDTLFDGGNYDGALELYQEALEYAKQYGDPMVIFSGNEYIFHFYYLRYKGTKEEEFLVEAKSTLNILEDLTHNNPDHAQMLESTLFCRARILKQGNLRNKGKAIDLLEEILKKNPEWQNFPVRLDLLDSLFEDVLLTGDKGTIHQIDELMKELAKIKLINNPFVVSFYIVQQITIAKYSFYIMGNLKTALDILYGANEHLKMSHFPRLTNKVEIEINLLEKEVSRWDNIDRSVKDRIKESNITSYLQQAMEISELHKS
ncbi:MAG: tetratricopeptide repeat protein [Candidatus Heimdallarchaeota archaeon]|nr:tetratricopeptide repeat protein [Candidatus Heimdallarchaeota archaeon]